MISRRARAVPTLQNNKLPFHVYTQSLKHLEDVESLGGIRLFSSRRRRRGGSSETVDNVDEEKLQTSKLDSEGIIKDREIFLQASSSFLQYTVKALEPMKAHNEVFHVKLSSNQQGQRLTVSLKPSEGQYLLQVDDELCTLNLISPMSGNHTYVLCAYTGNFIGMHDGHSCQGMLVRDMIRHCYGMPKF
jgi:hypothetical protein